MTEDEIKSVHAVASIYEFFGKKFPSDEIAAKLVRGKYYITNKHREEIYGPFDSTGKAFKHVTVNMHFNHYKVRKWKGKSFGGAKSHYGRLEQGEDGQAFHINPSLAYAATRAGHFD